MDKLFEVIHEDEDLLVINKPADLVCHPTKGDAYSSLISRVRLYLSSAARHAPRATHHDSSFNLQPSSLPADPSSALRPPSCSPHLVNRLDRETSGVTIVAKRAEVAGELGRLWETRAVEKEYLAIVHGHVRDDHGLIDAPLGKDEQSRVAIKDCVRPDGSPAQTEYFVLRRFSRPAFSDHRPLATDPRHPALSVLPISACQDFSVSAFGLQPSAFSLLRLLPRTGRKHQIRIHLASIGHPIVGDKIYGGDEDLYLALVENRLTSEQRARLILPHHALHAATVKFAWRGQERMFSAPPESWFTDFCAALPS